MWWGVKTYVRSKDTKDAKTNPNLNISSFTQPSTLTNEYPKDILDATSGYQEHSSKNTQ